ncbi:MAG TPA: hypothetical protein VFN35_21130 [Ktedonobacteraceae bacterium]|nr:hypothetical protein [Ktedonobacteraceae bacterium]
MSQQSQRDQPDFKNNVFIVSHPSFLNWIQLGAELFQQEHGQDTSLQDLMLLKFYQEHLTPFALDPVKHTGILLGWMQAFLKAGLPLVCSMETAEFSDGYHIATQDWHIWKKDYLLVDVEFAALLAAEMAPNTLTTMCVTESWYTETYQIGYAFGLVHGMLISPDIQIGEYTTSQ